MNVYESKHYKLLLLAPVLMLFFMFYFGNQVKLGIEFHGGTLITVPLQNQVDVSTLESRITSNFNLENLDMRTTTGAVSGLFIQFTGEKTLLAAQDALAAKDYGTVITLSKTFTGELSLSGDQADQADTYFSKARETFKNNFISFVSKETGTPTPDFSVSDIGPSLGSYFLGQAQMALIVAFVLIAILIFYYFKTPIISFAVVQSAAFDAYLGYAALGFSGIALSLATIAPLLMLIGYSVDTDIMLTDRILRRKEGTPTTRAAGAYKTGFTMVGTALVSLLVLFFISSYANIEVLRNISLILVVGLVGDLVATWCTNAVLVLWLLERRNKKRSAVV